MRGRHPEQLLHFRLFCITFYIFLAIITTTFLQVKNAAFNEVCVGRMSKYAVRQIDKILEK
jgi:hypothetical protein